MQLIGRISIDITGLGRLRSKSGAKMKLGGVNRKPVTDDQGGIHNVEETVPAEVECTLLVGKDTDIETIRNLTDATATFTTDVGKVYSVSNAFITEPPELAGGDGEMAIKLAGAAALKVK